MALKFLNKKGWHTGSLRNIENVWKAEQKHEAEQKKLEELRKQIHEERERSEFRQLQEQAGLVPRQERLEFLYDSGLAVGKGSSSGFESLSSKPSDPPPATTAPGPSSSSAKPQASAPGALFEDSKPQSSNDAWRKLHSDPLLMIRQREQEALARVKNNPVQMAMIRKSVEKEKDDKRKDKHRDKKSKHRDKKSKHHMKNSEDSSEDDSRRKKDSYRDNKFNERRSSPVGEDDIGRDKKSKHHKRNYDESSEDDDSRRKKDSHRDKRFNERRSSPVGDDDIGRDKKSKHHKRNSEDSSEDDDSRRKKDSHRDKKFNERRSSPVRDNDIGKEKAKIRHGNHEAEKYERQTRPDLPPRHESRHNSRKPIRLTEEERAARLREMQRDAEVHEEQRWKRLKKAEEKDAKEAVVAGSSGGRNFLDAAQRSVYGAGKGGSSTIEESVRRRTHYSQRSEASEGNAFRR